MIKIALCDDLKEDLERVYSYLTEYVKSKEIEAEITCFSHPDELLKAAEKLSFNMFILDIVMPMVTGIEAAREIRWNNKDAEIIFCTSEPSFALEAFDVNPINYLVKPVNEAKLYETLDLAFSKISVQKDRSLMVKTKEGLKTVFVKDILYIEYERHVVRFILRNGERVETPTLRIGFGQFLSENVTSNDMVQCHESFCINISAIDGLSKTDATLKGGIMIPVSKSRYKEVKEAYLDYRLD